MSSIHLSADGEGARSEISSCSMICTVCLSLASNPVLSCKQLEMVAASGLCPEEVGHKKKSNLGAQHMQDSRKDQF